MKDSDMTICRAVAIFSDIENPETSDHDKAVAIYIVTQKPRRYSGVKKEAAIEVIRWLWRRSFRARKEKP